MNADGCAESQLAGGCFEPFASGVLREGAQLKDISRDISFAWSEGPAVDSVGNLFFSDVPNSRIYRYDINGNLSLELENTQGANGLYFDENDHLLIAQTESAKIVKMDELGLVSDIASRHSGGRFNQTNDLWLAPNGDIYFTDPCYRCEQYTGTSQVYRIAYGASVAERVTQDLFRPNGIVGTADGKVLFVSEEGGLNVTYRYLIEEDGSLSNKQVFADVGSDGMSIDCENNIYLTARDGSRSPYISVRNINGVEIERIELEQDTANVVFAGAERDTLFITAFTSVYAIKMRTRGIPYRAARQDRN